MKNMLSSAEQLSQFILKHPKLMLLTGAGISTGAGIPDYRDKNGDWKRPPPVQHKAFINEEATRQRFWARSMIGWPVIRDAQPSSNHFLLTELQKNGWIGTIVTQNVDRLHQKSGATDVVDLHGRSDKVRCIQCDFTFARDQAHQQSCLQNPQYLHLKADAAPDGDADLEQDFSDFISPNCPQCSGIIKPDVVFFGDNVAKSKVQHCMNALQESPALMVVGSSLMVYSGLRFCKRAVEWNKPIAALTLGITRGDSLLNLKIDDIIEPILEDCTNKVLKV